MHARCLALAAMISSLAGCQAHLPVPREVSALGASSLSRPDLARRQAQLKAQAGLALVLNPQAIAFELRRAHGESLLALRVTDTPLEGIELEFSALPGGGVLARARATRSPEALAELEGLATRSAVVTRTDARPELALEPARRQALRDLVLAGVGPGREDLRCTGVLTLVELLEELGSGSARVEARGSVRVLERAPLTPEEARDVVREAAAERESLEGAVEAMEEAAEGS
ncbi:MAG TPA: hypothetical protein PK668_22740 [Myxococcota bacterium]|nr:hypothetical protein [Myxococcota bacterium]HRY95512.1 hypothetical protein [Myxococcota bacterium]HSA22727.1 hypothetical protein [Myxococcota bacterium]